MSLLQKIKHCFPFFLATCCCSHEASALPSGFVYLNTIDQSIIQDMRYHTSDNFIGRPIKGYLAPKCILTLEAAEALTQIQKQLKRQNMGLKVYDCYRPTMAVSDFVEWSRDVQDQKQKKDYYPIVNK